MLAFRRLSKGGVVEAVKGNHHGMREREILRVVTSKSTLTQEIAEPAG